MLPTSLTSSPDFLRHVLRLDALSCIACGVLQLGFPAVSARLFNLPQELVTYTGLFLLAYGAAVAVASTRALIPRPLVWLLVAGNLGWAALCIGLLASGRFSPTAMGTVYVGLQALTVLVLAELQYVGLRRAAPQPAW